MPETIELIAPEISKYIIIEEQIRQEMIGATAIPECVLKRPQRRPTTLFEIKNILLTQDYD